MYSKSRDTEPLAKRLNMANLGVAHWGKIEATQATHLDPALPKYEPFRNVLELQPDKAKHSDHEEENLTQSRRIVRIVLLDWLNLVVIRITLRKTPVDSMIILYYSTSYLYRFTTHDHLHNVKYSTYMRSAWWANQNIHLLYDHLARRSITVKITFTRYEKYVHVTTFFTIIIKKKKKI